MGKIIAVLIAVMMLAGCSTEAMANKSEYIKNMSDVNYFLSEIIGEINELFSTPKDDDYLKLDEIINKLIYAKSEAGNIQPPSKLRKAHDHYIKAITKTVDAAVKLKNIDYDGYNVAMREAEEEYKKAKPLVDAIKKYDNKKYGNN